MSECDGDEHRGKAKLTIHSQTIPLTYYYHTLHTYTLTHTLSPSLYSAAPKQCRQIPPATIPSRAQHDVRQPKEGLGSCSAAHANKVCWSRLCVPPHNPQPCTTHHLASLLHEIAPSNHVSPKRIYYLCYVLSPPSGCLVYSSSYTYYCFSCIYSPLLHIVPHPLFILSTL